MPRSTTIIFLKAPQAGRVKTRLAKSTGENRALEAYKALAERQLERIPEESDVEVHFAPANAKAQMEGWLGPSRSFFPQCEGDLGDRLSSAIETAYARRHQPVICIGGDCPSLTEKHIHAATAALENGADVAIGPTEDGGYYLIGLRKPFPELLTNIPWSSEDTLSATIESAENLNLKVHSLETLYDVDEESELVRAVNSGLLPQKLL